jgi:hypothetical protein
MSTTSSSFNYFEDYKRRVREMMETYKKEIDQEDNSIDEDLRKFAASGKTIPTFEVVVNKVSYRKPDPAKIETANTQQTAAKKKAPALETTAYEIQCELLNANELRMILLVLTNVDPWRVGRFIPYSWARKQPDAFHQSIVQHISFLNTAAKFPIFKAHPEIMQGKVNIDHRCNMEEDSDDDEDNSINDGSIRSLMTAFVTNEMTVVEYACSMAGAMENNHNGTPLFYGIERTSKSDTDGLYFILTHQDQIEEAQRFIEEDFNQIYKAADTYDATIGRFPNFDTPYMGSYQRSSTQIANEIAAAAKHNVNNGNESSKRNQSTRSSRSGITIDYGDFPKNV